MPKFSLLCVFRIWSVVTLASCLSIAANADVPENWTEISSLGTEKDRTLNRYGDRASLKYQEPWVIFDEYWLIYKDGKYVDAGFKDSQMSVNCLTGAWGTSNFEQTESDWAFLKRIERERNWQTSISILNPSKGLDANVLKFACHCIQPLTDEMPDSESIEAIYNSQIINQTSVEMVEVRTVMFETQRLADDALSVVDKNKVEIEKLRSAEGSVHIPNDGYLGWHPLASYSLPSQQVISKLIPGQISEEVVESVYGFNVHQLIARRIDPAASLQKWRSSIENYMRHFNSCRK